MTQRIAVVGGGPGGLFLATLLRRRAPGCEVVVFERNQRGDAFGFGVVFSDATLRAIDEADPVLQRALREHGRHWDRIDVWSKGERHGLDGNGMAAIHRRVLLGMLQDNAEGEGVDLRFGIPAPDLPTLLETYDVVVGADGTGSGTREQLGDLGERVETAEAKFIWFGTTHMFEGLTFVHRVSEHGNFAVHGYPISDDLSTFIVETDEETWRRAGLDDFDVTQPPGPSDERTRVFLEELFAEDIQDASLVANNSRWGNFRTRRTDRWHRDRVVLLGDAVHTAHFSVGSGTKMAMEDAVVLADELTAALDGRVELEEALTRYQQVRGASVGRIQDAAVPSLAWWEHFGTYQRALDPLTFTVHFFSRSIGVTKLEQRDPELVAQARQQWREREGASPLESTFAWPGASTAASPEGRIGRLLILAGSGELRDEDGRVVVAGDLTWVTAPADPTQVRAVAAALPDDRLVVIEGDDPLAVRRLSEEARLGRGLTTVMVGDLDDDAAETLLLSGRADAIARPEAAGDVD